MTDQAVQTPQATGVSIWDIDPGHTHVEFSAKHLMVSTVKGTFSEVTGTVEWNEAHPEQSTVTAQIDARTLNSRRGDRDDHLKSADFLEVERFPYITFRSKRIEPVSGTDQRFRLIGDLTIKDVTREVALDVEYAGQSRSPWGADVAGFTATTQIDRRDFGLTWNIALEAGGLTVGNEVKISLDVELIRRQQ